MLDAATLADHWLVRASFGPDSRWLTAIDAPGELVFVLRDGESSAWPAAVSVVAVTDADWPSDSDFSRMREGADDLIADGEQLTVRLARPVALAGSLIFADVRIDGSLPGSPLKFDLWIDDSPRLHLVGVATGPDLYELGRVFDSVTALLSAAGQPGTAPARSL